MSALWTSSDVEAATLGRATHLFAAHGVSIDTRSLKPGDLFVALKGDSRDGHSFVADAIARGAAAALVTHTPADVPGEAALLRVSNTQVALEDLGRWGRRRAQARVMAVTGSAGKTTTKEMLRLALGALAPTHASASSYNNHWGVPLSLAQLPRDCVFGVFEIGMNHFGEIRALAGLVRPHIALVTLIAPAHLEYFGSTEAIADAKSEIFESLPANGVALIPADGEFVHRLAARARQSGVERIMTFGENESSDARLIARTEKADRMQIEADILGQRCAFLIGATGVHMAQNAIATLLAVAALGGDPAQAAVALAAFSPLKGRGARYALPLAGGSVDIIDESYNANPASMRAALALLGSDSPRGRRIAILGDMLELGIDSRSLHAALAQSVEEARADLVFACGRDMRTLFDALPESRRGAWGETSSAVAPKVISALRPGDRVLIKGSLGSRMAVILDALKSGGGTH